MELNKKSREGIAWVGVIICILSVFFGLYMGLWVCFIGGIVTAVEGFKADPINSLAVGWGVLKFVCSAFVGWLSFGVGFSIGAGIVAKSGA